MIGCGQSSLMISEDKVSIFQVGQNVPETGLIDEFKISKQEEVFDGEGDEYYLDVYYVQLGSDTVINIHADFYNKEIIGQIFILSTKIKTKEGIGVGSTIEEFISKYNDYSIWWTYISDMCVINTDRYHMQFELNSSNIQWESVKDNTPGDMTVLEKSDIKPGSKIISIRLF